MDLAPLHLLPGTDKQGPHAGTIWRGASKDPPPATLASRHAGDPVFQESYGHADVQGTTLEPSHGIGVLRNT